MNERGVGRSTERAPASRATTGSGAQPPKQHEHPIDPMTLSARLEAAGFTEVEIEMNDFGWSAVAVG